MADPEHVRLLKAGREPWNRWREENRHTRPELSDLNFEKDVWDGVGLYDLPSFEGFDFSEANLRRISARNSTFLDCRFDGAGLHFSDVCFSRFDGCSFLEAGIRVTKLGSASFVNCDFEGADLAYCTAEETDFSGSRFVDTNLDHTRLVKATLVGCHVENVSFYGSSAWDLDLTDCIQRAIYIDEELSLSVESLEVAQFIHLLVRSEKLRSVIDTITSKVVLILGRFTPPRMAVLQQLRTGLSQLGYVPVIFDFERPSSRDVTESVSTLAHLSRFVVADLTEARSVPQELSAIVPSLPSVPLCPVIAAGEEAYGMFEHWERYPWVQDLRVYSADEVDELAPEIAARCERYLSDISSA